VTTAGAATLAELTTLRLGGPARRMVVAESESDLVEAVRGADAAGEPVLVLAGGSNVVVADEGFPGTVVLAGTRGLDVVPATWPDTDRAARRSLPLTAGAHAASDLGAGGEGRVSLEVQAGEPWDDVVALAVDEGWAGIECLSGIPGSSGATPIQNVGAYGQDVSTVIEEVRVYDRRSGAVEWLPASACGFRYRSSVFKGHERWIVLAVRFALAPGDASDPIRYPELAGRLGVEVGRTAPLGAVREAVLALRRGKGMVIDPADPDSVSAGSFFTNPILDAATFADLERRAAARLGPDARPPAYPEPDGRVKTSAAWLIERAGFGRGHGNGRVGISSKHSLALVNRGGATTAELVALARQIAHGVREAFGVELVPEPVFVGHCW
jgi:UDP-N-acetylmuramate dehydrogenase